MSAEATAGATTGTWRYSVCNPPHPRVGGMHLCHLDPLAKTSRGGSSPMSPPVSRTAPGCVTRHTRHASVTHFRPISGNIVEVTLVTSPNLYINSHANGTGFPLVRIMI